MLFTCFCNPICNPICTPNAYFGAIVQKKAANHLLADGPI
jgi:hypothetical protein